MASASTTLKPNVMAMIVVSTEPMTEAKPLTAQPQATYSLAVVGEGGHRPEAERHEHAEADAERRQHHERHQHPHRRAAVVSSASVSIGSRNR